MFSLKVKLCTGIKDSIVGLIGHKKAEPMMFLTRFGIHTFGLNYPIDVIILDKYNRVVRLKEDLKINSLYVWPVNYNKVIEVPCGFIKKNNLKIGREIKLL